MSEPLGTVAVVLHSHLPWVAHHGRWPVGEEWLHQAWAASWVPVVRLLRRLADEGRRDVATLGVTPVLAAQLDDAHCLREVRGWTSSRLLRAEGLAASAAARRDRRLLDVALHERDAAAGALAELEGPWRAGGSPVLRDLASTGVVELLGGPATHPVLPLLAPRLADAQLRAGGQDTARRLGRRPEGVWTPECAVSPQVDALLAGGGVSRTVVDGPTLAGATPRGGAAAAGTGTGPRTAAPWTTAAGLHVVGRDLEATYRVWSPTAGYPGHADYADFHALDPGSGLRTRRVTSTDVHGGDKDVYDPVQAEKAVAEHVEDFVAAVADLLLRRRRELGREPLVVVAWDTELFGHWWAEGPAWLDGVLRALPAAGVRLDTLDGAVRRLRPGGVLDLGVGSWGRGKDLSVWDGPAVAHLRRAADHAVARGTRALDAHRRAEVRDPVLDQLARELFHATSSDWAFGVSHDSAPGYLEQRAARHVADVHALVDALDAGGPAAARPLAAVLRERTGEPAHLDARDV